MAANDRELTQNPPSNEVTIEIIRADSEPNSQAINEEVNSPFGDVADHPHDQETIKDLANPYHRSALRVKAISCVGLGFDLFDSKGESIQSESFPDIFVQSNSLESIQELLTVMALDFEEVGNAYWEVVRNSRGEPAWINWLPSETVWIAQDRSHFKQKVNEKRSAFEIYGNLQEKRKRARADTSSEVIRFKMPSNRSHYYGVPDWLDGVGSIMLDQMSVEWNINSFNNNAIPSYALIIEGGKLSATAKEGVQTFLQENFKGRTNANRMLYLPIENRDVKVKFEKLMREINDGDFVTLRNQCRDQIISAHGVPPRLMGVVAPGALGGTGEAQQQLKYFKEVHVNERQTLIESILNRTICAEFGLIIKFKEIDISEDQDDTERIARLVDSEILTTDEGRELLELDIAKSDSPEHAQKLLTQIIKLRNLLHDGGIVTRL